MTFHYFFNLLNVNPNHETVIANYVTEMRLNLEIGNKFKLEQKLTFQVRFAQ